MDMLDRTRTLAPTTLHLVPLVAALGCTPAGEVPDGTCRTGSDCDSRLCGDPTTGQLVGRDDPWSERAAETGICCAEDTGWSSRGCDNTCGGEPGCFERARGRFEASLIACGETGCTTDDDCWFGAVCVEDGVDRTCMPADCQSCFTTDGFCLFDADLCEVTECVPRICGTPCAPDGSCAGGVCLETASSGPVCLPSECQGCFDTNWTCYANPFTCEFGGCAECRPTCTGRECGSDGCEGTCGECTAGMVCDPDGQCCTPQCDGRTCGPDGCGGLCGGCPENHVCDADGTCVCRPDCDGRECGPDGCGGSCGACTGGEACNDAGRCEHPCTRTCAGRTCGDDGCGGTCGSCAAGSTCDGTSCVPDSTSGATACLSTRVRVPTTPSCPDEIIAYFTNTCSRGIECRVCPIDGPGGSIIGGSGACMGVNLTPGDTDGGEYEGYYWCNAADRFWGWRRSCSYL